MSDALQSKLALLRADYAEVSGHPFVHFFCPILFKDDKAVLSKGHIVNQAFPDSARDWTVQRQDVDSFYGAFFEADFQAFRYHETGSIGETLTDKTLSNRLKPKILLDDKPVDYFVAQGDLPDNFTRLDIEHEGRVIHLGLKLPPETFSASTARKWEVEIYKDFRVPALVSLIKAAHLTLFDVVGYRYALSPGGRFIGRNVLGEFYNQNLSKAKKDVLSNAHPFFKEYVHIVRPLQANSLALQGTVTDKKMFVCGFPGKWAWALIVFIRTSKQLSAVLMPVFDHPDAVAKYLEFMANENETIEAFAVTYEQEQWKIQPETINFAWPKKGVLYP